MISFLNGTLVEVSPPLVVVECSGVGYQVSMSISSIAMLPPIGQEAKIYTHMIVRDDSHSLYGFLQPRDRELFQTLIRISGIGAKSAIGLLSALDGPALAQAVENDDIKMITRAPGIGKKNAERIIIELRDNKKLYEGEALAPIKSKALETLLALGYKATPARAALRDIDSSGRELAEIIKLALAKLSDI